MANPVFTLAPNPHWVIIDNFSKLPDGAAIYTYSSLNPSVFKAAFQDSAGNLPYGPVITGFANGTMPPIYWEFDPNNPLDTYYIRVYDSADPTTQQFLWDFNGLSGFSGGGGGTVITAFDIENQVINGIFYRNIGNQAGTPSLPLSLTLAPSNHAGYVNDPSNVNVVNNGPVGPDIAFAKNVGTSSDSISFTKFTPLGIHALPQDVTPELFINYNCTVGGGGETYKYVQFPISQGVQSLSEQPAIIKLFARCNAGNTNISLTFRQFYGSGGAPSADQITLIANIVLNNVWQVFQFPTIIPNATGKTLGSCGNDALFLQVNYSPGVVTNIDFVKPAVYLGTIAPNVDYVSNDQINAWVNSPRTGDIRISINNYLFGYVAMDDGTIGDAASASSNRANVDTFPLFSLIWNLFVGNQVLAPMFTNVGAPIAYGANPVADFNASRRLSLTRAAARVLAGVSGGHLIGTFTGAETHVLTIPEMPTHRHPSLSGAAFITQVGAAVYQGAANQGSAEVTTGDTGGGLAHSIMQPTTYANFFIKL